MSGGLGAGPSLIAANLFNLMARVDIVYVSYRGPASALGDLLGGHLQLVFSTLSAAIEYIRANKLRALAVTSAARSQTFREIPTVADFLPGYEASQWYGVPAPRNTPPAIVEKLNKDINAAVTDSNLEGRLADLTVALPVISRVASAQAYPARPMIVSTCHRPKHLLRPQSGGLKHSPFFETVRG
jgi:tripartite-type tricarboxylate transporter receptor subunit TctC